MVRGADNLQLTFPRHDSMSSSGFRNSPTSSSRSSPKPGSVAFPLPAEIPFIPAASIAHDEPIVSVLGPSPSNATLDLAPIQLNVKHERTVAKQATLVPGSGDGNDAGDECYIWTDLPMNSKGRSRRMTAKQTLSSVIGYRYAACAPSPTTSPSTLHPFFRTLPVPSPTPPVHISWLDRSQYLRLNPTALTASTDRGFRSARANVSVRSGSWYYEVLIERGSGSLGAGGVPGGDTGNAHVRLGWGRREANLDAPVGMDGYSYGIRDVGGEKVHLSRARAYGRAFGTGDVVGCLITLPNHQDDIASVKRKRAPLRYKGQMYFEMEEYLIQKEMEALVDREGKAAVAARAEAEHAKDILLGDLKGKKGATTKNAKKSKANREPAGPISRSLPTLDRSRIEFYLNGSSLGTAFTDLYDFALLPPLSTHAPSGRRHDTAKEVIRDDGTLGYFPMISCFGKGKVRANFGVPWLAPPQDLPVNARPMEERWDEWREEERALDERDEVEATERIMKEMRDDESRRKVAEARLAAVRDDSGSGIPKKKAKIGPAAKRRKAMVDWTESPSVGPTPRPTPTPAPEEKSTPTHEDVIMRHPDLAIGTSEHFKPDIENVGVPTMSGGASVSSRAEIDRPVEVKHEPLDRAEVSEEEKHGEGMHVDEGDHEDGQEGVRW